MLHLKKKAFPFNKRLKINTARDIASFLRRLLLATNVKQHQNFKVKDAFIGGNFSSNLYPTPLQDKLRKNLRRVTRSIRNWSRNVKCNPMLSLVSLRFKSQVKWLPVTGTWVADNLQGPVNELSSGQKTPISNISRCVTEPSQKGLEDKQGASVCRQSERLKSSNQRALKDTEPYNYSGAFSATHLNNKFIFLRWKMNCTQRHLPAIGGPIVMGIATIPYMVPTALAIICRPTISWVTRPTITQRHPSKRPDTREYVRRAEWDWAKGHRHAATAITKRAIWVRVRRLTRDVSASLPNKILPNVWAKAK